MDEVITRKREWYSGGWSAGWMIGASAWLLGRITSKNEYELALRSKTPHERAEHLDQAATFNLASNIGAGFFLYEAWRMHPKATSIAILGGFGIFAAASYAPLRKSKNTGQIPVAPSAMPPVATGWEPWEQYYVGDKGVVAPLCSPCPPCTSPKAYTPTDFGPGF